MNVLPKDWDLCWLFAEKQAYVILGSFFKLTIAFRLVRRVRIEVRRLSSDFWTLLSRWNAAQVLLLLYSTGTPSRLFKPRNLAPGCLRHHVGEIVSGPNLGARSLRGASTPRQTCTRPIQVADHDNFVPNGKSPGSSRLWFDSQNLVPGAAACVYL
jgi:hypothetical protein